MEKMGRAGLEPAGVPQEITNFSCFKMSEHNSPFDHQSINCQIILFENKQGVISETE